MASIEKSRELLELADHARRCGLRGKALESWVKEQLKPKKPKPVADYTQPLFEAAQLERSAVRS